MQLDSTFSVVAPIDTVWEALMDFERIAGCVPGAQVLNKLSEDSYEVGMKVKLGPVTMQYKGQMRVLERDATMHRAVFEGRAQEAHGQGTAQGTATLTLVESDGVTQGTVSADVGLSGKVAAMGKSIIGSVTEQMMTLFAKNLQAMLGTSPSESAAPAKVTGESTGESTAESTAEASASAETAAQGSPGDTAVPAPTPRPSPATADTSLNAFSLVKGLVMDQLRNPAKLLGLMSAVALVAFLLGRLLSGRKAMR